MTKRHYTHTICQFQLRPDLDQWSAIIIAGNPSKEMVKEFFVQDKIAKNTDLICGNQEFWKISDLMAYLEVADFSMPSYQLPKLVRKFESSDVLKSGDSPSEIEEILAFKRAIAQEKKTRINYQSIVYKICNMVDDKLGGIVSSDNVVQQLEEILKGDQS